MPLETVRWYIEDRRDRAIRDGREYVNWHAAIKGWFTADLAAGRIRPPETQAVTVQELNRRDWVRYAAQHMANGDLRRAADYYMRLDRAGYAITEAERRVMESEVAKAKAKTAEYQATKTAAGVVQ